MAGPAKTGSIDGMRIDPALVRPDDHLCDELQLAVADGLDANAFLKEIETVIGTKIPNEQAQRLLTLRDIVSYAASRSETHADRPSGGTSLAPHGR